MTASGRAASSTEPTDLPPAAPGSGGGACAIRFGVKECVLGLVLVGVSDKGVCAISLGDDRKALIGDLQYRFLAMRTIAGDATIEGWVARVVELVEKPSGALDVPLDIQGTAFQLRVWQALCKIPPGETASYSRIAAQIGQPKSARAVALACAANRLAVVIPCHRVIGKDGSLSGYGWGVERKAELLRRERMAT
jgi:AraC family transcriptional regulator of adaptative response/methylated-DNA-[protein]-cysteine methyltransferase